MPYKCETLKLKIPRSKDRRVKLTVEERQEIRELYGYVLSSSNSVNDFNKCFSSACGYLLTTN